MNETKGKKTKDNSRISSTMLYPIKLIFLDAGSLVQCPPLILNLLVN
jgi:hypothetical protein